MGVYRIGDKTYETFSGWFNPFETVVRFDRPDEIPPNCHAMQDEKSEFPKWQRIEREKKKRRQKVRSRKARSRKAKKSYGKP